MKYCYADTLANFMKIEKGTWMSTMKESFENVCGEKAKSSQMRSWDDCYDVLQDQLKDLAAINPEIFIIFEYVLRYTSRKRPDVILLAKDKLVILEFKRKSSELLEDRMQTEEYARKLYKYHKGCTVMRAIIPALVLSYAADFETHKEGIAHIVSRNHVSELVSELNNAEAMDDPFEWIDSLYAETPTVVQYSIAKKNKQKLPEYEIVRKAGISDAEACIHAQVENAYKGKKHIAAFVNGVPGAGKTLLGVDLAYDSYNESKGIKSTFMSGNGPLVAVLQDALDDSFIKNIHVYLDQYTDDGAADFSGNVCIFDEGQRIWTAEQRANKGKARPEMSEAALFIEMLDERVDWCFLLVLIGDGQEINSGETNGLQLWKNAIGNSRYSWEILCPPAMDNNFKDFAIISDDRRERLTLKNSLRSNGAEWFSTSVNYLVAGEIDKAKKGFEKSKKIYPMFVTRDLERAKSFVKNYYDGITDKKYGLVASSQSIILPNHGVNNAFDNTKQTRVFPAKWYNAPCDSDLSCCALNKPVTEFGCQGLELDLPIVCWEEDFRWSGTEWQIYSSGRYGTYMPSGIKKEYRINTYRVLLTRGRDGLIVYVPDEKSLDRTYEMLLEVGFEQLT